MRPKEDWTEFAKIQKERIKFVECMAEKETHLVDNLSLNVGRPVVSDEEEEAVADSHDRQHFFMLLHDKYNDEYDDQYDGMGDAGGVAGGIVSNAIQ